MPKRPAPTRPSPKKQAIVPSYYLDSPKPDHVYRVSRPLDSEAVGYGMQSLISMGYTRGYSIYFHPPEPSHDPAVPPRIVPLGRALSPEKRILIGTRPALFEDPEAVPKPRKKCFHEIEAPFEDAWRPYFAMKRRNFLTLTPEYRALLPDAFADRWWIELYQRQGSRYKRLAGIPRPRNEQRTCAFILNRTDFYQGASLTSFFAMDGLANLIFAKLVSERHPKWFVEPGFRMIELVGTPLPKQIRDLDFADDWELVSLIHAAPLSAAA